MAPKVLTMINEMGGCELWRTLQPMTELQRQGYKGIEWGMRDDDRLANIVHLFDAVVIQRLHWERKDWEFGRDWIDKFHKAGIAVIFEADDDLFSDGFVRRLIDFHGYTPEAAEERRSCILHALRLCDGATVSTQRVASTVRQYTDKPVKVVGNYIDMRWWKLIQKQAQREPKLTGLTIGWAGGMRPDTDVAFMAEAWARLAEKYPHITFVVQGHHAPVIYDRVPHERIAMIDWLPIEYYPAGLVNIDIGCCPLGDTPFNRSKTFIKAMEYAVTGAPVVASPTVYNKLIEHGVDGYIVETVDEWEQALSELVEDYRHRKTMTKALLAKVRKEYSLEHNVWRWLYAWDEIITEFRYKRRRVLLPREVQYAGV
jgi:glycosyltransferase involved in cell wall biosynthesis